MATWEVKPSLTADGDDRAGGDWTRHTLGTHRVGQVQVALPAHLLEAWEPQKCPCPWTLLVIPIPGIVAKVTIHKMGKAKGGLPTACGTGPKHLTGAFKALHRLDLNCWSGSFTPPSNA